MDDPDHPACTRFRKFLPGEIEASIEAAGISDYQIISDNAGFWMVIRKNDGEKKPE
ncbi:hypothetical protein [Methanoregula sp.]|uniref:hypothetical protein n=1 Tax=Methanoregula sp. TaxID=2052170 RepID=UPI003C7832FB